MVGRLELGAEKLKDQVLIDERRGILMGIRLKTDLFEIDNTRVRDCKILKLNKSVFSLIIF